MLSVVAAGAQTEWVETAKLLAPDAEVSDFFGTSVALDGTTLVVGTPWDENPDRPDGSAYVFERDSRGNWELVVKLLPEPSVVSGFFGSSVAVDGDTIVVGAQWSHVALVYSRAGARAWKLKAELRPEPFARDFGASVGVVGDTIVVGAPGDNLLGHSAGGAFAFERQGDGGWKASSALRASDGDPSDRFGILLTLDDGTVVVSAYFDDDIYGDAGAVYLYNRDRDGEWTERAKLFASDASHGQDFGRPAAVAGDRLLVGAPSDGEAAEKAGAAYVFERADDGEWAEVAKIVPLDGVPYDFFGEAVAIAGADLLISARGDDDAGDRTGSVYVFGEDASGAPALRQKLLASDGAPGDELGGVIAVHGDTVAIGAQGHDAAAFNAGAVYVFERRVLHGGAPSREAPAAAVDGEAGRR